MKPLNQPERRTRLWQFSLLYLLALLVPLGASYYFFSNSSIADENARLTKELDLTHQEQERLVMRFDTLTHHLRRIDAVDMQIMGQSNPNMRSVLLLKNQDYGNAIAARLSELSNDTAQMQVTAHRLLSRNILKDFDFYRSTRKTIDILRQEILKSEDNNKGCGRLADELASAKQDVAAAKQDAASAKQQLAILLAAPSRPGPNTPVTPNNNLKLQVDLLVDKLAFAEADCLRQRAIDHKPRSRERKQMLEQSRTAFIQILQAPATDNMKQSIEQTLGPINVELGREPRFFGLIPR